MFKSHNNDIKKGLNSKKAENVAIMGKLVALKEQSSRSIDWLLSPPDSEQCTGTSKKKVKEFPDEPEKWRCPLPSVFGTGRCRFHGGLGGKPSKLGNSGLYVKNLIGEEIEQFKYHMAMILMKYDIEDEISFMLLQKAIKHFIKAERTHEDGYKEEAVHDALMVRILAELQLTPKSKANRGINISQTNIFDKSRLKLEKKVISTFKNLETAVDGENQTVEVEIIQDYAAQRKSMERGNID